MSVKTNIEYLKIAINNREKLEKRYMILNEDLNLGEMVLNAIKIKELLTAIKVAKEFQQPTEPYYNELRVVIAQNFSSNNEFNSFINACDSTVNTIRENPETLNEIVELFLKYRSISDHTPKEWVQALIDKGSSKKLGNAGNDKVIEMAIDSGFSFSNNDVDFFSHERSVIKYTKKIHEKIDKTLSFGNQDKNLDVILKSGQCYAFIEVKHLKEGGGSQDKQVKELISLLDRPYPGKIKMIAFTDGMLPNSLLRISEEEILDPRLLVKEKRPTNIQKFKHRLVEALKTYHNSYWLNTSAYEEFLKDF